MSLLEIIGLSHAFGDQTIYRDADFALYKGDHVGIVGQNGAGKSTLIGICTGEIIPDKGRVVWQPGLRAGHLDQYADIPQESTVREFLQSAFQELSALEKRMNALYLEGTQEAFERAAACQAELEARDFYGADVRVDKVANGLGLNAVGMGRKISEISGGQRAKAILAKLLLVEPDVLLLDEPTNFLDKEHVDWLADFLNSSRKAFMVVSHDHGFLERISNAICDIDGHSIRKYAGKYSEFLKQKQHLREDYVRRYQTQQKEIQKTEEYIRKNIAGVNSKNAKGRRKQLERVERMAPPDTAVIQPTFQFQALPVGAQEHLKLKNLAVGYDSPLLSGLNFTVTGGHKIVVTGFNGVGKSTLLKTLTGQLPAWYGSFRFAETTVLNYYSQDLAWDDPEQTPVEIVAGAFSALNQKEARRKLFRCGISSVHALQGIGTLSGGEQAKVKMCLLTLKPCNFLILDEPTNHLDVQAKEALKTALEQFSGTVLLVSHEEAFYRDWAQRIINVEKMMG